MEPTISHPAFEPLQLGRLRLRNRILKTATYEGMVVNGLPSELLKRHHVDLARGGVAMTTVAYCTISPEGRTFSNQMVMRKETVEPLRAVTDAVHREGAAVMLQLGHCGGFSKNEELGRRGPLGPSFGFNAYGALKGMPFTRAMGPADLARTREDFVRAAVSLPLVYLGGATSLDDLARARAEGFEMVAMGRALLRDPELVARYARGERRASTCEPCNRCITEMDRPGGVVCALERGQLERRAAAVARGLHLQVAGPMSSRGPARHDRGVRNGRLP